MQAMILHRGREWTAGAAIVCPTPQRAHTIHEASVPLQHPKIPKVLVDRTASAAPDLAHAIPQPRMLPHVVVHRDPEPTFQHFRINREGDENRGHETSRSQPLQPFAGVAARALGTAPRTAPKRPNQTVRTDQTAATALPGTVA